MIKFFRKIRQELFTKNKFIKYLLYAIGEILLVIIGILMALQINNSNTIQNNLHESDEFTIRLVNEVKSNILITINEIESKKASLSSSMGILKMIDRDEGKQLSKTLDSLMFITMGHNQIELNLGTLNEGLNTGKVALIPSDALRSALYSFHSKVEAISKSETYNNHDIDNYFMSYLYDHFNFRQMDGVYSNHKELKGQSKFTKHNNLLILDDLKFESLIDNRTFSSIELIASYERLKLELESLVKMIEKE